LTSEYLIDEICSASPSASSEDATISPCDDIAFSLTALVTSLATGAVLAAGALVITLMKSPGLHF
jgi:flagellar capping protein FliD